MFTMAILYYASYWGNIQIEKIDTTKYTVISQHLSQDVCRADSISYEINGTGGKKHKYLMFCIKEAVQ